MISSRLSIEEYINIKLVTFIIIFHVLDSGITYRLTNNLKSTMTIIYCVRVLFMRIIYNDIY